MKTDMATSTTVFHLVVFCAVCVVCAACAAHDQRQVDTLDARFDALKTMVLQQNSLLLRQEEIIKRMQQEWKKEKKTWQSEKQRLEYKVQRLQFDFELLLQKMAALRTDDPGPRSVTMNEHPKTKMTLITRDYPDDTTKARSFRDVITRSDDTNTLEPVVSQMSQQLGEVRAEVQALKSENQQQAQALQEAKSSVYVRWGRSVCPSSNEVVYTGVVGGAHEDSSGSATNYLCLTLSPVYSSRPVPSEYALLYGGEYQTHDSHYQKDPLCAVCRSPRPTTVMVPGTNLCQAGWTREYSGYLMAGDDDHTAGSEFICVDSHFEDRIGSEANQNGKLMYFTVTHCGSLPCPPYVNGKIVTCAVCSK